MELYQKYIDTVTFLKKMQGETISESGWKKEFYHTVQKGERGNCLITRTKNGEWYEEQYEYNGIIILMCMDDENYNIRLIPPNIWEYANWRVTL